MDRERTWHPNRKETGSKRASEIFRDASEGSWPPEEFEPVLPAADPLIRTATYATEISGRGYLDAVLGEWRRSPAAFLIRHAAGVSLDPGGSWGVHRGAQPQDALCWEGIPEEKRAMTLSHESLHALQGLGGDSFGWVEYASGCSTFDTPYALRSCEHEALLFELSLLSLRFNGRWPSSRAELAAAMESAGVELPAPIAASAYAEDPSFEAKRAFPPLPEEGLEYRVGPALRGFFEKGLESALASGKNDAEAFGLLFDASCAVHASTAEKFGDPSFWGRMECEYLMSTSSGLVAAAAGVPDFPYPHHVERLEKDSGSAAFSVLRDLAGRGDLPSDLRLKALSSALDSPSGKALLSDVEDCGRLLGFCAATEARRGDWIVSAALVEALGSSCRDPEVLSPLKEDLGARLFFDSADPYGHAHDLGPAAARPANLAKITLSKLSAALAPQGIHLAEAVAEVNVLAGTDRGLWLPVPLGRISVDPTADPEGYGAALSALRGAVDPARRGVADDSLVGWMPSFRSKEKAVVKAMERLAPNLSLDGRLEWFERLAAAEGLKSSESRSFGAAAGVFAKSLMEENPTGLREALASSESSKNLVFLCGMESVAKGSGKLAAIAAPRPDVRGRGGGDEREV